MGEIVKHLPLIPLCSSGQTEDYIHIYVYIYVSFVHSFIFDMGMNRNDVNHFSHRLTSNLTVTSIKTKNSRPNQCLISHTNDYLSFLLPERAYSLTLYIYIYIYLPIRDEKKDQPSCYYQ